MTQPVSKKLFIKSYGCQMNVYDAQRMGDLLAPHDYELTAEPDQADMVILNTCHIREKAEQKLFSDLGRLRQKQMIREEQGQEMLIAVGGCVAQAEGAAIVRQAPYVSMVFGPQTYHQLPEMIERTKRKRAHEQQQRQRLAVVSAEQSATSPVPVVRRLNSGLGLKAAEVNTAFPTISKFDSLPRTRQSGVSAFLSIQEGCDNFCTFCVVPYTRGAEFSRPVRDIIDEATHLVSLGAREITLLGQNVNAYHGQALRDGDKEWGIGRLIRVLADISGLERLRYTTSHPMDMDDDLIAAHGEVPALMPFLHLPVQSGSDIILKRMNRRHKADHYRHVIEKLRIARPDMAFSSDFIVGFPGETDHDHQQTLALVADIGYAQAYSFKYSIRPGTPAGAMDAQVADSIKDQRLQELQALINQQQVAFNEATVGSVQPVLLDREGKKTDQLLGRTPYMQSVHIAVSPEMRQQLNGQTVNVLITQAHANSLTGQLI